MLCFDEKVGFSRAVPVFKSIVTAGVQTDSGPSSNATFHVETPPSSMTDSLTNIAIERNPLRTLSKDDGSKICWAWQKAQPGWAQPCAAGRACSSNQATTCRRAVQQRATQLY